jgi:methionyl aminopeptidase
MVNLGRKEVRTERDGWTIYAKDRKPSAHYEHSIVVLKTGPQPLSDHSIIEEALEKNPDVQYVGVISQAV